MTQSSPARIVVGSDHSARSDVAIRWATDLAADLTSHLTVTTAYHNYRAARPDEIEEHRDGVRQQLISETRATDRAGIPYAVLPEVGEARDVLQALIDEDTLLVIGADADPHNALAGVGGQLIHHLDGPLAIVPSHTPPLSNAGIVVGVDASSSNDVALRWAADVARRAGAPLTAIYADHPVLGTNYRWMKERPTDVGERVAEEHVQRVAHLDLDLRFGCYPGKPVAALRAAVADYSPAALVLGMRGAGGFGGAVLGDTVRQLVREPPCPVIVVPH